MSWNYYRIHDKEGHIEMEIYQCVHGFKVHFPRFENGATRRVLLEESTCFVEMRTTQLAMLLFTYNVREYEKFCDFLEEHNEIENKIFGKSEE